jgi:hypothetical protein
MDPADPDPACRFDTDPDPALTLMRMLELPLKKPQIGSYSIHFGLSSAT